MFLKAVTFFSPYSQHFSNSRLGSAFNCWKVGKEVDELELTPMIYFNWSERCLL